MKILRAYKTELKPNSTQRELLIRSCDAARAVWNWGLALRRVEYEQTGKSSNAIDQHKQLNQLKKTEIFSWLYEVSKCTGQESLRDLDKAFKHFFRRCKQKGAKPGYPKFKSRKNPNQSFRVTGLVYATETHAHIPRIGKIRLKEHGYIPVKGTENVKVNSATVSTRAGRWFVSFQVEEIRPDVVATGVPVGVDLGVKALLTASDGRTYEGARALRKSEKRLNRAQRSVSRKVRGSRNRYKARLKLAKVHYRIACQRKDTIHKAVSAVVARTKPSAERPCEIVLETLNVSGMVKNHCLAKSISDASMSEASRQFEYKAAWGGSTILRADPFYPSSKLCNVCGHKNDGLGLKDRTWTCPACGTRLDRDLNAAKNLRDLSSHAPAKAEGARLGEAIVPSVRREFTPMEMVDSCLGQPEQVAVSEVGNETGHCHK